MEVKESIARQIEKSKKQITIVFTDIVGSTAFWEKHGDTAGRLMVDAHNKLMFAVVKSYRGSVVKTIGDSILATFRRPQNALWAAIHMQQILRRRKRKDKDLRVTIRIGIHTGEAIVERSDIYGDAVNVASRVEGTAEGNGIVVSRDTVDALGQERRRFYLEKRGSFVPKGKTQPLDIYGLNWQRHKKITKYIKSATLLPVPPRQSLELVLYLLTGLAAVYLVVTRFVFYLFADFEFVALYLLNPHQVDVVIFLVLFMAGLACGVVVFLIKVKQISPFVLRLLKGLFGFGIGFLVIFTLARLLPGDLAGWWNGPLLESEHLFVEVVHDDVTMYSAPYVRSKPLATVDSGSIFLQNQRVKRNHLTWMRVLFKSDRFGYLLCKTRPTVGVPARRLTISDKFYFRLHDLYALLFGLAGFAWGFVTFRIRPM